MQNTYVQKRFIVLSVLVMSFFIVMKMTTRSIWVDEGMLLWNISTSSSVSTYLNPLPYYDQAQPALVSLIHHFILHEISRGITFMRAINAIIVIALSASLYLVMQRENAHPAIAAGALLALAPSIAWYITEIKHYSYEFAAVCTMVTLYILHSTGRIGLPFAIVSCALFSALGFSTIIPAFVLCFLIIIFDSHRQGRRVLTKVHVSAIFISVAILLLIYFHMKHLTIYQINNHHVYSARGLFQDINVIRQAGMSLVGNLFSYLVAILAIMGLLSGRNTIIFRLSIALFLIVAFVTLGKITGLYPALYQRHLFWLTPILWAVIVMGLTTAKGERTSSGRALFFFGALLIVLKIAMVVRLETTSVRQERASNNALYSALAELEPSSVVIFPHAQPTLDYYRTLDNRLNKHLYYGYREPTSKARDPDKYRERFYDHINQVFADLPDDNFLYLVSHQHPLFSSGVPEWQRWRGEYVESKLISLGCSHEELFAGVQTQLVLVQCPAE